MQLPAASDFTSPQTTACSPFSHKHLPRLATCFAGAHPGSYVDPFTECTPAATLRHVLIFAGHVWPWDSSSHPHCWPTKGATIPYARPTLHILPDRKSPAQGVPDSMSPLESVLLVTMANMRYES